MSWANMGTGFAIYEYRVWEGTCMLQGIFCRIEEGNALTHWGQQHKIILRGERTPSDVRIGTISSAEFISRKTVLCLTVFCHFVQWNWIAWLPQLCLADWSSLFSQLCWWRCYRQWSYICLDRTAVRITSVLIYISLVAFFLSGEASPLCFL